MTTTVHGFDLGHRTTAEAEHWLSPVPGPAGLIACTHLVHGGQPRVVVTLAGPPLPELPPPGRTPAAEAAVADHTARRAGRAFRFPGVRELTGLMTVGELLAASAIDAVRVIGGPPAAPGSVIDTRGFVRPQWQDGRLVLVATPAPAGRIAPFEVPNPTPCCGGSH